MSQKVNQDAINKALWAACDTFRGTISADTYKDFVLTMLFLKYISDVWQDHYDAYVEEHGDEPELIDALLDSERFKLPKDASFYALFKQRHEPGNGERIDQALHAIEEANGTKLKDAGKSVFQDISFNTDKLGEEKQKNAILRHLLEDFAKPELDLRPSRVGTLDVIGNAYEYMIKLFAASGGQKAGEFYTPPEVSELMAELQKVSRVIKKVEPEAPHHVVLVLDATTGQNALTQVGTFKELVEVTGLVVTKLDGSARGGVLVALAEKYGLPVHVVGVGEGAEDFRPFTARDFARALVGLDQNK